MVDWSLREKLQPSLLDRLTDEEPSKQVESASNQVINESRFKEAVIRDLAWLLNTVSLDVTEDLEAYPEVQHSVINYGMPDLTGQLAYSIDVHELEKTVHEAITKYEPRILRESLKVKVSLSQAQMSHNALGFDIRGSVFGQPVPFQVILRSQLDLESGDFKVSER